MGVLYSCWCLIDTVIIPYDHGQSKWLVLSYFIHPLVLVYCQFYLFGRFIASSVLLLLYYPIKVARYMAIASFRLLVYSMKKLVVVMELDDASIIRLYGIGARRERWFDFLETEDEDEDPFLSIVLYNAPRVFPPKVTTMTVFEYPLDNGYGEEGGVEVKEEEEEEEKEEAVWQPVVLPEPEEEEEENTEQESQETENEDQEEIPLGSSISYVDDRGQDAEISSLDQYSTAMIIWETRRRELMETETDEFFKEYMNRMNCFDKINSQGIYVVSMSLNIDVGNPAQLETIALRIYSLAEKVGKDVISSIESSFEMVYVAQSCLSWEALHHQYRKVETLASSVSASVCAFYGDVAGKFQQFQVLLERFTESGRLEGKRFWNYSQKRFSSGFLLQVPSVTGFVAEAHDNQNEKTLKAGELLRVIEKAIMAFQDFLEEDKIKPPGKLKKLFSVDNSQVENPNDLVLLIKLAKDVNKKEARIKNLQRQKRRKLKTHVVEVGRSNEFMFSLIDVKIVSRTLKMSMISTQQLKWCEEKLNSIQVKKGLLIRNSTSILFPYS